MNHFDCPRVRGIRDLHGKDGTQVMCGPEDRERLTGGVRADA